MIYLCPAWYKGGYVDYKEGDMIKVLGCLSAKRGNPPLILARMINKNGRELWFRNYDGKPLWDFSYSSGADNKKPHPGGREGKGGRGDDHHSSTGGNGRPM